MNTYTRYAIFYAPAEGSDLARFGAQWLGWDAQAGREVSPTAPPDGWESITRVPRRYGLHGTLKPPFRLAGGAAPETLRDAIRAIAATRAPVRCAPLHLARLGRFRALQPCAPCTALADLAAEIVVGLDGFRAPATVQELARRRAVGLSARQEANLARYGYPYVLDEFRFHLTLTGAMDIDADDRIGADLRPRVAPFTAEPFEIREICLFGEHRDGRFRILKRFALAGAEV